MVAIERLESVDHKSEALVAVCFQPHRNDWPNERLVTAGGSTLKIWSLSNNLTNCKSDDSKVIQGKLQERRFVKQTPSNGTDETIEHDSTLSPNIMCDMDVPSQEPLRFAQCLAQIVKHAPNYIVTARWSPNGETLASCDNWQVLLWRLSSDPVSKSFGQKEVECQLENWKLVTRLTTSCNHDLFEICWLGESFILGGSINDIKFWNVGTQELEKCLEISNGYVKGISSYKTKLMATESNDQHAIIWQVSGIRQEGNNPPTAKNARLKKLRDISSTLLDGPEDPPCSRRTCFDPAGKFACFPFGERDGNFFGFASRCSAETSLNNVNSSSYKMNSESEEEPWRFRGHESRVNRVAFTNKIWTTTEPGIRSLCSTNLKFTLFAQASLDGAISVWRYFYNVGPTENQARPSPMAQCIFVVKPRIIDEQASFVDISWSPRGNEFAIASDDGSVTLVTLDNSESGGALFDYSRDRLSGTTSDDHNIPPLTTSLIEKVESPREAVLRVSEECKPETPNSKLQVNRDGKRRIVPTYVTGANVSPVADIISSNSARQDELCDKKPSSPVSRDEKQMSAAMIQSDKNFKDAQNKEAIELTMQTDILSPVHNDTMINIMPCLNNATMYADYAKSRSDVDLDSFASSSDASSDTYVIPQNRKIKRSRKHRSRKDSEEDSTAVHRTKRRRFREFDNVSKSRKLQFDAAIRQCAKTTCVPDRFVVETEDSIGQSDEITTVINGWSCRRHALDHLKELQQYGCWLIVSSTQTSYKEFSKQGCESECNGPTLPDSIVCDVQNRNKHPLCNNYVLAQSASSNFLSQLVSNFAMISAMQSNDSTTGNSDKDTPKICGPQINRMAKDECQQFLLSLSSAPAMSDWSNVSFIVYFKNRTCTKGVFVDNDQTLFIIIQNYLPISAQSNRSNADFQGTDCGSVVVAYHYQQSPTNERGSIHAAKQNSANEENSSSNIVGTHELCADDYPNNIDLGSDGSSECMIGMKQLNPREWIWDVKQLSCSDPLCAVVNVSNCEVIVFGWIDVQEWFKKQGISAAVRFWNQVNKGPLLLSSYHDGTIGILTSELNLYVLKVQISKAEQFQNSSIEFSYSCDVGRLCQLEASAESFKNSEEGEAGSPAISVDPKTVKFIITSDVDGCSNCVPRPLIYLNSGPAFVYMKELSSFVCIDDNSFPASYFWSFKTPQLNGCGKDANEIGILERTQMQCRANRDSWNKQNDSNLDKNISLCGRALRDVAVNDEASFYQTRQHLIHQINACLLLGDYNSSKAWIALLKDMGMAIEAI